jgi:hypothetical protein
VAGAPAATGQTNYVLKFNKAGTLFVDPLNSVSGGTATSNLGAPTNAAGGTISLGSTTTAVTLLYTGPEETSDRILNLTGGITLAQGGTGAGLPITQAGQSRQFSRCDQGRDRVVSA